MSTFRRKMGDAGYDPEEAYFHKKDQELIQNMREKNKAESKPSNVIDILPRGAGGLKTEPIRRKKAA